MDTTQVLPDTRTKHLGESTVRVRGYPGGQQPYKGLPVYRVSAGPVRVRKVVRVSAMPERTTAHPAPRFTPSQTKQTNIKCKRIATLSVV